MTRLHSEKWIQGADLKNVFVKDEQKPITQGKQVSQLPRNAIRANTRNLTNHENSISSVSQHHSTIELHPNDPKSQNPQRKPGPLLLNQKASRENSNPFDPLRLRGHKKSNSSSNADYLKAFDAEKHGNHLDLMRLQKNQFQTEIDPHSNGKSTSGVGFLKENQVGESWNPKKEISAIAERGESQFSEIFSRTSDAEPKKRNKNEGPAAPITTSQNNNKSVFAGIMRRKKSGLQIQRGALSLDDNSIKELEATLNKLKFVSKFSGKEILKDPTIPGIVMSFSKQLRAATGKVVWPQSAKETVGVLQQIVENMADALRSKTQKNSENPSSFCSSIQSSKSRNKRKISHQVKEEIGMSSVPEGRGKPECKEISSESLMSFKNKKFITIPSVDSRSGSANNKETPAFSKTGNKTSKKNVKKTYVMESSEDESRSNNVTDEHIVVPFDFSQKTQELIKEERKKKKGEKKTEEKPVYHLDVGRGVYKKKKVGESLKKPNTRAHSEASVKNKKKSRKGEAQEMEGRGSFGKNNAKGKHLSMQHEMGRNGLNDSLKLAIPNNIDRSGFHEEFMSRLDEFSQSWRKAAMKEKRF